MNNKRNLYKELISGINEINSFLDNKKLSEVQL